MKVLSSWRSLAIGVLALTVLCASATPALGAAGDPLWVFAPKPTKDEKIPDVPPPYANLNGPCGLGVDSAGSIYISDYYRRTVNVFLPIRETYSGYPTYVGQLTGVDPLSGPCGVAFDAADNLYVNSYHRSVVKYGSYPGFGTGTVIAGAGLNSTKPTGVAVDPAGGEVYVNARTYVAVYDSSGAPVMDGAEPLRIGLGDLENGYGVAFSQHPATLGRLYVPDAATGTVKVYEPAVDTVDPVAEIDGSATPEGRFVSLRDAAIAVDRVSGDIYVVDNLQPFYAEQPIALVHVFAADGTYKGHLKYPIRDALPPGLAVDNSPAATYPAGTQGQVYVTSGNTAGASVYAYPPGAAIMPPPLPAAYRAPAAPAPAGTPVDAAALSSQMQPELRLSQGPKSWAGETQQVGNMLLNVSAKLSPRKLPREGRAPIAVSVGWKISSTDGTEPAKLKTIKIEINRNGVLDATGLPVCPYAKIQPASTQRALRNCRSSLVGEGSFSALVGLEGQERYAAKGKMLVFNGMEKGKPVLFGQLYSAYPFANSFVVVFKIGKSKQGTYGTTLSAKLPANLRAWGNLTEVEMRLSRNYRHKGKRRSFVSAGCPAPKGLNLALFRLARTTFSFTGGTNIASTLTEQCNVKR